MAHVILPGGKQWQVYATKDLEKNWAVSLKSGDRVEGYPNPREFAPILVKVRATSRRAAVEAALKRLKDEGQIQDYVNDVPEEKAEGAADEEGD